MYILIIIIIMNSLAHSILSSLTYWQKNSCKWRSWSQLYSVFSIILLIDLSLLNLALHSPTQCTPTLMFCKGLYCHFFVFHCTLPTAGSAIIIRARLTSLLTIQDWSRTTTTLTTDRKLTDLLIRARFVDCCRETKVGKCRCLSLIVNARRAWHENTNEIIRKVHSRLFCLRPYRMGEEIFLVHHKQCSKYVCVCWGHA